MMAMVAEPETAAHPAARAWIHRLSIRSFRNLERVEMTPGAEGLAVIGDNGQGKSNFLEAIYYVQLLRSFRGARDRDLTTFGAPGFHLAASTHGAHVHEVAVGFEAATARKRVTLDGVDRARLADALGALPAVIFSPQDVTLVTGAPSARRRYLDILLSLTSRPYLLALQRYRAALARRNAAMRAPPSSRRDLDARVAVWEPTLAESGARLWTARRRWSEQHAGTYASLCAAIGEEGSARLRYTSALGDERDAETQLLELLERKRAMDIRRGLTHAGPHRDDLELTLAAPHGPPRDLRTYGSAGQQRTAAIALRLLEAATLRAAAACDPVVLLDDPFAELDTRRAARILELLTTAGRGQTMLAVPRPSDIPAGLTRLERWTITGGVLAPAPP
ncbi:MAG TPA: DNA replication and repair protein RecF [Gemmatimonadaceae bacterium]|nr:DNA replication and repair protein RecF [Gemmatimonadaceae bacterium]